MSLATVLGQRYHNSDLQETLGRRLCQSMTGRESRRGYSTTSINNGRERSAMR